MIDIIDLTFQYGKAAPVFKDFRLHIDKGAALSVIGPSGCGKTTLLYLTAGLKKPVSGSIIIGKKAITRPRPETGLVLQDHGLLPWATVWENARLGLSIRAFYGPDGKHAPETPKANNPEDADAKVNYWLDWLGITAFKNHYPDQLSRGQRQRTAIARTLATEPDFLLLDEPFSALDAPIRSELQHVMRNLNRETKLTSMIVTHDIDEAVFMGDKILILKRKTNHTPHIIDNPLYHEDGAVIRSSAAYRDICRKLRELLEAFS